MNVLITGGAGFIGSHLCDKLVEANFITVIDDLSLGKLENISHLISHVNFKFIKADINNCDLDKIFLDGKFDIVYHLAANSDIARSFSNPQEDISKTFMTTFSLLNVMRKFEVKKIIFSSSSAIYGMTNQKLHEDYGPLFPVSHYGATKLASEAIISSFSKNYGIKFLIIRFPNVVGERATHGVIFDFINKLKNNPKRLEVLGNGKQIKPYLYVKDLVNAILYLNARLPNESAVFNIGVDSRTNVKFIAENVIKIMNLSSEIIYTGGDIGWIGDVPEFDYDLTKINEFGWTAKYSSNDAVIKAINEILKTKKN